MPIDINSLPLLKTFAGLKRPDAVYLRKYGTGNVESLYNDDVICRFSEGSRRVSVLDKDLSLIVAEPAPRRSGKAHVLLNGREITLKMFKKTRRNERELASFEAKHKKLLKKPASTPEAVPILVDMSDPLSVLREL